MVGWHHLLNGHEFEQTPGKSERQGSLACCSPMRSQRSGHNLATEQQQVVNQVNGLFSWLNQVNDLFSLMLKKFIGS